MVKRKVGIVGYGHLGQYLVKAIEAHPNFELGFVWNRTASALQGKVSEPKILRNLEEFRTISCDLIVEVAHPCVVQKFGAEFLQASDLMVGSPSALADQCLEDQLRSAATHHGLYVPSGAFWGSEDIRKMADRGTLKGLKVTMKKHPSSFKLEGHLKELNDSVGQNAVTLYDGPVRDICPLAPNNVNTMAAAAIAGHNLGFDGVQGCLISDPNLLNWHCIEIDVIGPGEEGQQFRVKTERLNPAAPGAVTGSATYGSFLSSLNGATGKGSGFHLC